MRTATLVLITALAACRPGEVVLWSGALGGDGGNGNSGCPPSAPTPSFYAGPSVRSVVGEPTRYVSGAGYAALTLVPRTYPLGAGQILYSLPTDAAGSLQVGYSSPSAELLEVVLDYGGDGGAHPGAQRELSRVHTRNLAPGQRSFYACSWGGGAVQCGFGGALDVPSQWGPYAPAALSSLVAGKNIDGTYSTSSVDIERVEVGTDPLTPDQAALLAEREGTRPSRIILVLGDSRSSCFNDGPECWHAELIHRIGVGPGRATATRWAVSGYTCADARGLVPGGAGQPGVTDATVLCGINDVFLYGKTATEAWTDLAGIYSDLHDRGIRIVAMTVPPARGFGGYAWTQAKEDERTALNALILQATSSSPPAPLAVGVVDRVVDADALMQDPNAADTLRAAYTYDWLHFTPAGADALGALAWTQGFDSLVL